MAISYRPKVGEVLECKFGHFKMELGSEGYDLRNYDGRIPHEMVKTRMVVVLNPKLTGNMLIVPVSSTKHFASINMGLHIPLEEELFKVTDFYDKRERWAKCEAIQLVSKERLFKLKDGGQRFDLYLPRDKVTLIQKAVCKSINAASLLQN